MTTAVRLAEDPARPRVRIVAAELPECSTSAAAGAIWDPIYANHPMVPRWSVRTYRELCELEQAGRPEVRLVDGVEASRKVIPAPDWAMPRLASVRVSPVQRARSWRVAGPWLRT